MIRSVLFDLDGTLVDSRQDLADAVNHALRATGQPEQGMEDIVEHIGNGMRVLLAGVMGPVSDETLQAGIAAFQEFYERHCLDKTKLYEGVAETLSQFGSNTQLAVVTNKPVRFTEGILRGLKIRDRFAAVIGGGSLPERKPHPAPVLRALHDMDADEGFAMMVGDGEQDVLSGQAAGILTCAARYGFKFDADVMALTPNFTIDNFRELKEIVS